MNGLSKELTGAHAPEDFLKFSPSLVKSQTSSYRSRLQKTGPLTAPHATAVGKQSLSGLAWRACPAPCAPAVALTSPPLLSRHMRALMGIQGRLQRASPLRW